MNEWNHDIDEHKLHIRDKVTDFDITELPSVKYLTVDDVDSGTLEKILETVQSSHLLSSLMLLEIEMNSDTNTLLSTLDNLQHFEIRTNKGTFNLQHVNSAQLNSLTLSVPQIEGLYLLEKIIHLEDIDITLRNSTDIAYLQNCSNLKKITIRSFGEKHIDVDHLSKLDKLVELSILGSSHESADLSLLHNNHSLDSLALIGGMMSEVILPESSSLRTLVLTRNKISELDLSPLAHCTSLEKLYLGINEIVNIDLSPLAKCTNLEFLYIDENSLREIDVTPLVSCKKLKAVSVDLLTRIILQETPPDMPSVLMDLFREHNRQSSYDKKQKHFIQELVNFNEKREGDMEKTPSRQLDDEFVYESMETFLSDHFKPLKGLSDIINRLGEIGTEKAVSLLKQFLEVRVNELPTWEYWEYERTDWHLRALNVLQNVTSVEVGKIAVEFVASFKFDYDDEGIFMLRTSTLEALDKAIELAVQCGREDIVEHLWRFVRYNKYATQGRTPSDIAALWIARIEGTSALFQLWKHFIKHGTVYTWFDWGIWHAIESIGPEAHPELTELIEVDLVDTTEETRDVLNNLLDRIK